MRRGSRVQTALLGPESYFLSLKREDPDLVDEVASSFFGDLSLEIERLQAQAIDENLPSELRTSAQVSLDRLSRVMDTEGGIYHDPRKLHKLKQVYHTRTQAIDQKAVDYLLPQLLERFSDVPPVNGGLGISRPNYRADN